jgi:hypothetical protein
LLPLNPDVARAITLPVCIQVRTPNNEYTRASNSENQLSL